MSPKKFRMVIAPMPGNFSSRDYPEKTGLWQVIMSEVDELGVAIESPENQVQIEKIEYDEAMTACIRLQKQLEEAQRSQK